MPLLVCFDDGRHTLTRVSVFNLVSAVANTNEHRLYWIEAEIQASSVLSAATRQTRMGKFMNIEDGHTGQVMHSLHVIFYSCLKRT